MPNKRKIKPTDLKFKLLHLLAFILFITIKINPNKHKILQV